MSFINIVVHDDRDGKARTIAWGTGATVGIDSGKTFVELPSGNFDVRETKAEIDALVAAEQRKRDRLMLAGQFLSGAAIHMSERPDDFPDSTPKDYAKWSVDAADALLAALDAREGAE